MSSSRAKGLNRYAMVIFQNRICPTNVNLLITDRQTNTRFGRILRKNGLLKHYGREYSRKNISGGKTRKM